MTERRKRVPKWPDRVEMPEFTLQGAPGGIRPDRYDVTRTVLRRRGQPYVRAVVVLERLQGIGLASYNMAYVLTGRIEHPWKTTADYRRNAPLGVAQRAAGTKALHALAIQIRESLMASGWRKVGPGGQVSGDEWWQAPEGAGMDEQDRRRLQRAPLLAAASEALTRLLDGDGDEEARTAQYQGRTWGVSAHRTSGGNIMVILDSDPWREERTQAEAEWREEHGESLPTAHRD